MIMSLIQHPLILSLSKDASAALAVGGLRQAQPERASEDFL